MKAREVRERLKGRVDPEVSICMEALAEKIGGLQKQIMDMALAQDEMINIISNFASVAENMKNTVDTMKNIQGDGMDGPTI
jgi:hypothetical protein